MTRTASSAPASYRSFLESVWTGTKMVVWGGYDGTYTRTGAQYDPASNSWTTATSIASAPPPGQYHSAVWTGSRMIVWGGFDGSYFLNSGAQYNILSLYVKN